MTKRSKNWGTLTHKELIDDGYVEMKKYKGEGKKPCKDCINSTQKGTNGRWYIKVMKMTKAEKKIFRDSDKRQRDGKQVWLTYQPDDLWMKLSVDVKKDKRGNVTVSIKEAKKGYCHKWDCPKKAKKNYVLCPAHLSSNRKKIKSRNF